MGTVLLGWTHGSGLGHLSKLVPLARRLTDDGHRCVLAATDLTGLSSMEDARGIVAVPSPPSRTRKVPKGMPPARCHTGMLDRQGFQSVDVIRSQLRGWDGLFELVRPDVVVADHAPPLLLAARGKAPAVIVGTGFTVPPAHLPEFPVLIPAFPVTARAPEVLRVVNAACELEGRDALPSLPTLYEGTRVIGVVRELDLYAEHRPAGEFGVPWHPPIPAAKAPGSAAKGRVFAYLAGEDPRLPALLGVLGRAAQTDVYVRNCPPAVADAAKDFGVQLHATPQDFAEVLPNAALVVHHGGAGTSHAGLFVGRPQLVVPRVREAELNGGRLMQQGVARVLPYPNDARMGAQLEAAVRQLANDEGFAGRAFALAHELHGRERTTGLAAAHQAVSKLLSS